MQTKKNKVSGAIATETDTVRFGVLTDLWRCPGCRCKLKMPWPGCGDDHAGRMEDITGKVGAEFGFMLLKHVIT